MLKFWLMQVFPIVSQLRPKLYNINLHNITHSLISQNRREWMFIVQISLLIVTFFSFMSRILSLMQTTKKVNPHPHIVICVNMWSVTFYSCCCSNSYAPCWMLVHACATSPRKAKWIGPHQRRWEGNDFKFHSVTCCTDSIVSCIHVNPAKLRNITCTFLPQVWYYGV